MRRVNILGVGAHPDDIELGCGGTLLRHAARGDQVTMLVMTTGGRGPQGQTSRIDEQREAMRRLGATELVWGGFNDGSVPEGQASIDVIQGLIDRCMAEVVYCHTPRDTHQDHRATAVATISAARHVSCLLMYEAPSSRGFSPSLYIDVNGHVEDKLEVLRAHTSQVKSSRLVDLEAIEAQARYRGFQSRTRFAEAFEVERFVWDLHGQPASAGGDVRPGWSDVAAVRAKSEAVGVAEHQGRGPIKSLTEPALT